MYGWRGRLGVVIPATDASTEPEFAMMIADGVSAHFQRFAFEGGGVEVLKAVKNSVFEAVDVVKTIQPSSIGMCCTAGSFSGGKGWDQSIINQIENTFGIPATTASTAVIEAFKALGVSKITMVVPYIEEIAKIGKQFLEDNGFDIVCLEWLGKSGFGMQNISHEEIYQLVKKSDAERSDAILISCAGLSTAHMIEIIEMDRSKPVVTTNQAFLWHMLKLSQINAKIEGFGRLFSL